MAARSIRAVFTLSVPIILFITMTFSFMPLTVDAATYTVDTLLDENDGCAVNYCSLREAIDEASHNDVIHFAVAGTIDISSHGELVISKSLTISSSLPVTISGNNSSRVFNIMNQAVPTATVHFHGLTIVNGAASHGGGMYVGGNVNVLIDDTAIISNTAVFGGGIYLDGTTHEPLLTLNASTISHNVSSESGGGIHNEQYLDGSLTLRDSHIGHNSALNGGGLFNYGEGYNNLLLENSQLIDNRATDGGGIYHCGLYNTIMLNSMLLAHNTASGHGGGIFNGGLGCESEIILTYTTLISNSANSKGGGIYNYNESIGLSDITLNYSRLAYNSAGYGGGLFNYGYSAGTATITIDHSSIAYNWTTTGDGGGLFNTATDSFSGSFAQVTVNQSTIFGNRAANSGGGIYNDGYTDNVSVAKVTLNNSTLANNVADVRGGGLYNISEHYFDAIRIYNSTFSHNEADSGGGLYLSLGKTYLYNTIVANSVDGGDCFATAGSSHHITSSLIEDSGCGATVSGDPLLGAFDYHGGDTRSYTLLPTSSAIDSGDSGTCLSVDQRGANRPQDGNGDGTAVCDLGAVEFCPLPVMSTAVITQAGLDNLLNWVDHINNSDGYEVWRSASPMEQGILLATLPVSSTSYLDTSAPVSSVYYMVVGRNLCGETAVSNMMGRFSFMLVPK